MRALLAVAALGAFLAALVPVSATSPGVITRVSVSSTGEQGDAGSGNPAISADGRYIAFGSDAVNFLPGDMANSYCGDPCAEIFIHDRETDKTESVSGNSLDGENIHPAISDDGRVVAFEATSALLPDDTNRQIDVYLRHLDGAGLERISGQGGADAALSGDGRFVAYHDFEQGIVVYDRHTRNTEMVAEGLSPDISADGRFVAFMSEAADLVPSDTNGSSDIFVLDRSTASLERVSISSTGAQANGHSGEPRMNTDGRVVAFVSVASNLVPSDSPRSDPQLFVRDLASSTTTKVSVSSQNVEGNSHVQFPEISGDGRFVAFFSISDNLVPGDTNHQPDTFLHDRETGIAQRVNLSYTGEEANDISFSSSLSADARFVAFDSHASNLVQCDTNDDSDVFVRDIETPPQPPAEPVACSSPQPTAVPPTGGQPAARYGGRWPVALSLAALGAVSALLAGALLGRHRR